MLDKLSAPHYAALGIGLAALIGLALWPSPDTEAPPPSGDAVLSSGTGSNAAAPARRASGVGGLDPMSTKFNPAQLFELGYAGGLRIDGETQSKLAQIVSDMPPEPSQADIDKLEKALRDGLPREDAEKAIKLVKGYRGYVGDVKKSLETTGIPTSRDAVDAMFRRMEQTQNQHFERGTAQALFGEEMRDGRLVMEAALVSQDPNLTWDEKKQRLDALRAQLPAHKANSIVEPEKPESAASAPAAR